MLNFDVLPISAFVVLSTKIRKVVQLTAGIIPVIPLTPGLKVLHLSQKPLWKRVKLHVWGICVLLQVLLGSACWIMVGNVHSCASIKRVGGIYLCPLGEPWEGKFSHFGLGQSEGVRSWDCSDVPEYNKDGKRSKGRNVHQVSVEAYFI